MINFIVYEDNRIWQQKYKDTIFNIMESQQENYQILTIETYTKELKKKLDNLSGKKIFLLDMEVPRKSGLDLAREIRQNGDWTSQIIMITSYECFKEESFTSKILMLDFITKDKNVDKCLHSSISLALEILSNFKSFNFTYNNTLYQIPYEDILYFEKNLNNNYTSIITKNNHYKMKESIKNIETKLDPKSDFFKTHQSCIVNLKNIMKVDFTENRIYFSNVKFTDLLARNKKKELKLQMAKENLYDFI